MVRFINCFEVPEGREDDFLDVFTEVNAHMVASGSRSPLHKSLAPDAKYRFINYVEWESAEHWKAAHGPDSSPR